MSTKSLIIFAIIILILIIIFQNNQVISFHFLFWKLSISKILLLPFMLLLGFIIGFFIGKNSWDF